VKNSNVLESEKRLTELKTEITEKEQYLNSIKKEISFLETNNKQANDQGNSKSEDRIAYRDKQIEVLKKELDEKNSQIKVLEVNEKTIQNLKSEIESIKKSSNADKAVLKNDIEKVIEDLKKENENLKKEISYKNIELKKLNEKLIEKEGENLTKNETKSKEINAKDLNVDLKRSLIEKDIELNNLKNELEKIKKVFMK
jgi:predicted RNase H-like nuclease (RuvC/YqgF family)